MMTVKQVLQVMVVSSLVSEMVIVGTSHTVAVANIRHLIRPDVLDSIKHLGIYMILHSHPSHG